MNRLKMEHLKKYLATRKELTAEEVAELDLREKSERESGKRASNFHSLIFPDNGIAITIASPKAMTAAEA